MSSSPFICPATMLVTAIGLGISLVLGLALAVVMDESDLVRKMIYPIVVVSQTIPTTAIAPLFVLWFGYGIWSKVLVTVLITFFPITITVYDGLRSRPRRRWRSCWRLTVPRRRTSF